MEEFQELSQEEIDSIKALIKTMQRTVCRIEAVLEAHKLESNDESVQDDNTNIE